MPLPLSYKGPGSNASRDMGSHIDRKYFGSKSLRGTFRGPDGQIVDPRKSEFKRTMDTIGGLPSADDFGPSDDEKKLRGLGMGALGRAFGDDTSYMDSAFGRLLTAQASEGTDAGIRQFMAQTGSSGSAAAAATAASIRSGGAANLHKAALEARSRDRSEASPFLSFLSQSFGRESQQKFEASMFSANLRASIMSGIVDREHDAMKLDKQIALERWKVEKDQEQKFYDAVNAMTMQRQQQAAEREAANKAKFGKSS